jgi:hypothetical protein
MSVAVVCGVLTGLGCVCMFRGLRVSQPSLEAIAAAVNRVTEVDSEAGTGGRISLRVGRAVTAHVDVGRLVGRPRWKFLLPYLAITRQTLEGLAWKMLVLGGICLLGPPALWLASQSAGVSTPVEVPLLLALVVAPVGVSLPIIGVIDQGRERQRHFRVVVSSFVDLVVLGLAGGVGVEGALFAASRVSGDWAARRMARVLLKARDTGQSPWVALGQLGVEIGVPELVELSTTLQLAGTEGARIRQSLSARAVSLRRHEQADAESAANAMTERLFLPGALLLVGFLLFVGYPAFSRILGGF